MGRRPDNQIVGVCRFSYPATGGFRLSDNSLDTVIDTLYAQERMRRRFLFFENICLPSLAAQTDTDFTLVVLVGDMMPLRWRKRLKALRRTHDFLRICAMEPLGPLLASRRAFRFGADDQVPFVTGFRIDDDDAVAVDFIERLRAAADGLLGMGWVDARTPVTIGFQSGLYWDLDAGDLPLYRYRWTRPLGLASAMVTGPDTRANIYRWNHAKLLTHTRCWTDPTPDMFIRTLHAGNDSDASVPARAERVSPAETTPLLRRRFGLAPLKLRPTLTKLATSAAAE